MYSDFSLNTIRKGKTYDVLSKQRENGNGTKNTRKSDISPNKQKEKRMKHVSLSGRLHIEERLTKGRSFNESIKTKTKQNKSTYCRIFTIIHVLTLSATETINKFIALLIYLFSPNEQREGGGGRCQTFFFFSFFPCSADHERGWPPCKVVFSGWQPMR